MIELRLDDKEVIELLKALQQKMADLSPVMSEIGEIILSSVEENFQQGGRYLRSGTWRGGHRRWKPLSPATVRQRKKEGTWPGQILVRSGRLASSISKTVRKDSVTVGTNLPYAAIHQFGGRAGRGRKVRIPARPFLVIQREDLEEIQEVIREYLMEG